MFYYKPIGISGAALVGKDTLCKNLMHFFENKHKISAKRVSIAGDIIKNDIKTLISSSMNCEIDPDMPYEKNIIRPLLVEYGRYARNKTKGRYFLNKLNENEDFGRGYIPILTDIRYAEYENDELFWVKHEKKGILIFLERKGVLPANQFEEKNNIILKNNADFIFNIPNIQNLDEYYELNNDIFEKIATTYLQDTFQPLNMF